MPWASEMATFLSAKLEGTDVEIVGVSALGRAEPGTVGYVSNPCARMEAIGGVLYLAPEEGGACPEGDALIRVPMPRLAFARLVEAFFYQPKPAEISPAAHVAADAVLGPECRIEAGAVIESGVVLGDGCTVEHNAVVRTGSRLGRNCVVGPCAVLGSDGLSMHRDEAGHAVRIRHLGGLQLGEGVEIGANSTVQRGTIEDTRIEDNVKTSPNVNVGHNVWIGQDTVIASGACICGSARVGRRCFVGAGAVVREGVTIGDDAFVGMQAAVISGMKQGERLVGLNAVSTMQLIKLKHWLDE